MSYRRRCPRLPGTLLFLLLLLFNAGCRDGSPTGAFGPDPDVPATVEVSVGWATLVSLGDTLSLSVRVRSRAGAPIPAVPEWSSSDVGVATVDSQGRVVAVGNGKAIITAAVGTATATSEITVLQQIDSIVTSGDLQEGEVESPLRSAVVVTAFDARGNPVKGAPAHWDILSGGWWAWLTYASSETDASGQARARWTLGEERGPQQLQVTLGYGAEREVVFTAMATLSGAASVPALAKEPALPVGLAGDWTWTRLEQLTIPDWFAAGVLGIQPEGRYTHARCESSGVMWLSQAGADFEGAATATVQECLTSGGQGFVSPGFQIPTAVEQGRMRGNGLRFVLSNPMVRPCPFHATIEEISEGVATALSGGGRCVLPGHPRSESVVQLDPPPGGTSVTLRWEAVRP